MEGPGPDIHLPGRSSSPTPAVTTPNENGGTGPAVCALCLSAAAKYTCPQCNAPYCSLTCYKGARHSACSELFYRDSVLQTLRAEEPESRGRREVEEMLLKLREDEEESGLWSSLSRQEKEHFNSLLKSGHIASLVPRWKPWWDTRERAQGCKIMELHPLPSTQQEACPTGSAAPSLTSSQSHGSQGRKYQEPGRRPEKTGVQEVASHMVNERKDSEDRLPAESPNKEGPSADRGHHQTHSQEDSGAEADDGAQTGETLGRDPRKSVVSEVPPLLRSIPPLRSLTRKPSPLVRFSVVNVIYSYSFSLLRHNGDLSDEEIILDFIGTVLSVSGALSTTAVYNSTAHAVKSAVRAASDPLLGGDEGVAVLAMEATGRVLLGDGGTRYSLAALSHLYHLLGKIRKLATEEKDVEKSAFTARKKCLFLAAWVNENGDHLALLSAEVMVEYNQYLKGLKEMEEMSKGLQRVWGGKRPPAKKKLIEEVD